MKTPLPKFPHHRGVPKHHFGVKTPLLATLEQMAAKLIFISLMVAGRPVLPGLSCCYVSCWQVGQMRFRAGHAWIWSASALAFRLVYFMRFHHSCYYLFIYFLKIIFDTFLTVMLMIQNFNLLEDCGPPALTPVAVDTNFYAKPRRWCSRRQWCGCNLWPPRPLTPKSPIAKSSMTKSQEKNPLVQVLHQGKNYLKTGSEF